MTSKFADFLLEALVNAARIDGAAAEAEREAIVAAMGEAKGAPFARTEVDAAIERASLTREDLTAYLAKHGARFTRDEKMAILRGLLSVIAADGVFAEQEKAALMGYIEAIGFGGGQASSILDAIMQPFRNAV